MTTACYLSFKTRNVAGVIAGSKVLLVTVYNIAFTCGVIILITHSLSNVDTIVISEAMGICFCVITTAVLLVLPIYHQILFVGDDAAHDGVMDEVMRSKPDRSFVSDVGRRSEVVYPDNVEIRRGVSEHLGWGVRKLFKV